MTWPMLFLMFSVNQRAPSGPAVIPRGPPLNVGVRYSLNTPAVVIRPILLTGKPTSPNHSAPSGPDVMPVGLLELGVGYSVSVPAVVTRPILPPLPAQHNPPPQPV